MALDPRLAQGTFVPQGCFLHRHLQGAFFMKGMGILGVVLIVIGVAALFFGHFSFTETKPVVQAGPLQINSQEDHTVWIPTVAGIVVVLAGLGLVLAGRKSS
jgi:hypothetical protein